MRSLEQLIQIAPPPAAPVETGSPKQWDFAQKQLGTPLPKEYRNYIDHYGTGSFNKHIIPFNPFARNESVNLIEVLDVFHRASRKTQSPGEPIWSAFHPFDLFPATEGVLPWGTTANFSDSFLWQVSGLPETWATITYNLRNGEYEVWKMSFTNFLVKLLLTEIESVVLSDGSISINTSPQFNPDVTGDGKESIQ